MNHIALVEQSLSKIVSDIEFFCRAPETQEKHNLLTSTKQLKLYLFTFASIVKGSGPSLIQMSLVEKLLVCLFTVCSEPKFEIIFDCINTFIAKIVSSVGTRFKDYTALAIDCFTVQLDTTIHASIDVLCSILHALGIVISKGVDVLDPIQIYYLLDPNLPKNWLSRRAHPIKNSNGIPNLSFIRDCLVFYHSSKVMSAVSNVYYLLLTTNPNCAIQIVFQELNLINSLCFAPESSVEPSGTNFYSHYHSFIEAFYLGILYATCQNSQNFIPRLLAQNYDILLSKLLVIATNENRSRGLRKQSILVLSKCFCPTQCNYNECAVPTLESLISLIYRFAWLSSDHDILLECLSNIFSLIQQFDSQRIGHSVNTFLSISAQKIMLQTIFRFSMRFSKIQSRKLFQHLFDCSHAFKDLLCSTCIARDWTSCCLLYAIRCGALSLSSNIENDPTGQINQDQIYLDDPSLMLFSKISLACLQTKQHSNIDHLTPKIVNWVQSTVTDSLLYTPSLEEDLFVCFSPPNRTNSLQMYLNPQSAWHQSINRLTSLFHKLNRHHYEHMLNCAPSEELWMHHPRTILHWGSWAVAKRLVWMKFRLRSTEDSKLSSFDDYKDLDSALQTFGAVISDWQSYLTQSFEDSFGDINPLSQFYIYECIVLSIWLLQQFLIDLDHLLIGIITERCFLKKETTQTEFSADDKATNLRRFQLCWKSKSEYKKYVQHCCSWTRQFEHWMHNSRPQLIRLFSLLQKSGISSLESGKRESFHPLIEHSLMYHAWIRAQQIESIAFGSSVGIISKAREIRSELEKYLSLVILPLRDAGDVEPIKGLGYWSQRILEKVQRDSTGDSSQLQSSHKQDLANIPWILGLFTQAQGQFESAASKLYNIFRFNAFNTLGQNCASFVVQQVVWSYSQIGDVEALKAFLDGLATARLI